LHGDGRIARKPGKLRKIDGCQFSNISITEQLLTVFFWIRVKTFETLRDRVAICQITHCHFSLKPHPALAVFCRKGRWPVVASRL
jgi:hypothetical protein